MTVSTLQLTGVLALGRSVFAQEIELIKKRVEQFAQDCALAGKPLEFGDSLQVYVKPIRTWFYSLHAQLKSLMEIDRIPAYVLLCKDRYKKESALLQRTIEQLQIQSATMQPQTPEPPYRYKMSVLLLIAHVCISLTEAATVAGALQLFGSTILISAIAFVSLFFFFYFLPLIIVRILSRIEGVRKKILVGASLALVISGLFWFLGSVRASYTTALSDSATVTISPMIYVVFNWMFLCLSIYLLYRRSELSDGIRMERHLQKEVNAYRAQTDTLKEAQNALAAATKGQQHIEEEAASVLDGFRSLEAMLSTSYQEAVELFRVINLKLRDRIVPDCFAKSIAPLFKTTRRGDLPTIQ